MIPAAHTCSRSESGTADISRDVSQLLASCHHQCRRGLVSPGIMSTLTLEQIISITTLTQKLLVEVEDASYMVCAGGWSVEHWHLTQASAGMARPVPGHQWATDTTSGVRWWSWSRSLARTDNTGWDIIIYIIAIIITIIILNLQDMLFITFCYTSYSYTCYFLERTFIIHTQVRMDLNDFKFCSDSLNLTTQNQNFLL